VGELLNVGIDGKVGLGMRAGVQTGTPGAFALSITPDRRVGIALNDDAVPGATLDVNGDVRVGTLTCGGVLKAQSFEGNGSKLQNLPILSYWTKQNVGSPDSPIYYDAGRVGVQMRDPPASLSVGTGQSFVGSGVLSVFVPPPPPAPAPPPPGGAPAPVAPPPPAGKPQDGNGQPKSVGKLTLGPGDALVTLKGSQTAFKGEVQRGDAIRLGELMQQYRQVRTIVDDKRLELTEQFSLVVRASSFKYLPAGSTDLPGRVPLTPPVPSKSPGDKSEKDGKDGSGTISSSGTTIIGKDTKFTTELREGDWIAIPEFRPSTAKGYQRQWLVSDVKDDQTLVVIDRDGGNLPANVSAYMVSPALIAVLQANALAADVPPPPAMLVVNNRQDMKSSNGAPIPDAPNTVAINLPLEDIDYKYALQVEGAVNFQGGGTFDDITAKTIEVTQWIKIAGAGDGGNVLTAGSASTSLLTVTQSNVVIGTSKGTSLLEIGGDAHASGNLSADGQLQGGTAKVTGLAEAGALTVKGVQVNSDGSVMLLGTRASIPISVSQPGRNGKATTDGLIVVQLSPNADRFYGLVTLTTKQGGAITNQSRLTAAASQITTFNKDGTVDAIYYVPQNASMCVPVRKGEDWDMAFTTDPRVNPANVSAYWIPFGTQSSAASFAAMPVPNASHGQLLRQVWGSPAESMPFAHPGSQEEIDRRVAELTHSVGEALHLPTEGDVRQAFIERLQKLVCSAAPSGAPPEGAVNTKDIDSLVDFLGTATGRAFAPLERELLNKGIRALIAINDNDTSRNDPALIRRNILMFMEYAQKALGVALDPQQARDMIRALVRIVGTGTRDPFRGQGDAST
jgi:hypothetical protein